MQTKKNFKNSLQIIAILFVTILSSFAFLNIFKTNKLSALEDEISFVVGTTSIKQTNASLLADGTYNPAYENKVEEIYTLNPNGNYIWADDGSLNGNYYYIKNLVRCDKDGKTDASIPDADKTHYLVKTELNGDLVVDPTGNLYRKSYIHGYNYISFPDYIKTTQDSAEYILINGYYQELIFSGENANCYEEDKATKATTLADTKYIKHNGEMFYELTDANSYIALNDTEEDKYSYNVYKLITDPKTGTKSVELFNYADVDKNPDTATPLFVKSDDKSSAYIPTYKSYLNSQLTSLYIESTFEEFEKPNSTTIEITTDNGKEYYRPLFDTIYANNTSFLAGGNSTQENIPFITLDNYAKKANLDYGFSINENIQNLYLSFGEVYIDDINDPINKVINLEVSANLENKFYNDPQRIKINEPVIQELPDGTNNYFWFQYLDASNIESFIEGSDGETKLVTHPEGKYTFTFTGNYLNSSKKSIPFTYTYTVYLTTTDNNNSYPTFNSEFISNEEYVYSGEMTDKNAYETFFYNFQEDYFPTYTYDASIFDVTINRNLNLVLSSKTFDFESLNYSDNFVADSPQSEKEYGLVSEYDDGVLSKKTLIVAERYDLNIADIKNNDTFTTDIDFGFEGEEEYKNYDSVVAFNYVYSYKTDGFDNIKYFNSSWGTFSKKILVLVFYEADTNTSIIKTYEITNKDKVTDGDPLRGVVIQDLIKKEKVQKSLTTSIVEDTFGTEGTAEVQRDTSITQTIINTYASLSNPYKEGANGEYEEIKIDTAESSSITNRLTFDLDYFKEDADTFSYSKSDQTGLTSDPIEQTLPNRTQKRETNYKDVKNSRYSTTLLNEIEFEFLYDVVFDDLGVYDIENRYTISTVSGTSLTGDWNENLENIFKNNNNNYDFLKYTTDNTAINPTYDPNREYTYEKLNKNTNTIDIVPINYQKCGYSLHVFGIKSYFNNNGVKAEFKNDELGIYSDATKASLDKIDAMNAVGAQKVSLSTNIQGITLDEEGYPIINVPVTNMSPITFDYFGLYSYNGIIPVSKYYKYEFKYDDEGKVYVDNPDNFTTHYFTKDTFPSDDGYYEIITEYTYKDYDEIKTGKAEATKFHQVFSFVIDNSSPSLTFEKLVQVVDDADAKHLEWTSFGKDDYTNSAVRISWAQTSYFQYNVIPKIEKTNFDGIVVGTDGSASTLNFQNISNTAKVEYPVGYYTVEFGNKVFNPIVTTDTKQNVYEYKYENSPLYDVPVLEIKIGSKTYENVYPTDFLNENFVEEIKSAGENISIKLKKRVNQIYITTTSTVAFTTGTETITSNTSIWGSGKYQVRLYYGYQSKSNDDQSKSYLTQGFTIDNLAISGLQALPVNLNSDEKMISQGTFSNNTKNLIKDPFTFIYDKKASGASIEASYTVVPFSSNTQIDKLNLLDSLAGITGTELVNAMSSSASIVNHYVYDYSFKNPGDTVYENNIFTPTSSALYIFNLKDSAGNTAEFFISFDLSTPNFFVDPVEEEEDYIKEYNIITGLTEVSWGDYKAIKITPQENGFNDGYIFGNAPNYLATNVEKMMKNIYQNSDMYSGAKLVRTWTIKTATDERIEQIPSGYLYSVSDEGYTALNFNTLNLSKLTKEVEGTETKYFKNDTKNEQIITKDGNVEISYYILINIRNVNFTYHNTNSDDTSIYSFDYKLENGKLAKNETILSPTRKALINYWANPDYVSSPITLTDAQILNDSTHTYGFYGEKKYLYVITDMLGNEAGNSLWMNLDLTLAMAFGNFTKTDKELTVSSNVPLTQLTPYGAYTASQVYFSWLVDKNTIPESKIDFKFFDFDLDFYSNYVITGISYDEEKFEYTFSFKHAQDDTKTRTVVISNKDLNNYNGDDEKVSEPVSMYPYQLENSGWNVIMDSTSNSDPATMATSDENRFYSSLLRATNEGSFTVSQAGLYLFRRVYTDYLDENGVVIDKQDEIEAGTVLDIGDDTVYRYYLYYIDRNGIIDLSTDVLNFLLGMGMNDEDYSKEYTQKNIKDVTTPSTSENISYSSVKVDKLFLSNKAVIQMNLTMDKYNQPYFYNEFNNLGNYINQDTSNIISSNLYEYDSDSSVLNENAYKAMMELVNKYMFGVNDTVASKDDFNATKYFNDKFLLKLQFNLGTSSSPDTIIGNSEGKDNRIDPNISGTNRYLLDSLTTRPNETKAEYRNELKDGILVTKTNNTPQSVDPSASYNAFVKDSAGVSEGSNISEWNKFANELSVKFGITSSYPDGYYFGKDSGQYNLYESTSAKDEAYKDALFNDLTNSLTTNTLQDLNGTKLVKDITLPNHYVLSNTNNETLIFYFEKTTNNEEAQIEPYQITLKRTTQENGTQLLFNVKLEGNNAIYSGLSNNQEKLKKALLSNATATEKATKWALVVFDNYNSGGYKNLLSDATLNATYEISIQYKGIQEDYSNYNKAQYYFKSIFEITIDNVKPLYNLIKLMENDTYIPKTTHKLTLPSGYTNIDEYYNKNLSTLGELALQAELEKIYNYYMESYYIKDTNGSPEYFKNSKGDIFYTYNGNPIAKTYIQNYFFGVNKDFELSNINKIDTSKFYYREISNIKNYHFSLTKDDFPTTASESTFVNNPLFDPTTLETIGYSEIEVGEDSSITLENSGLQAGKYYEIIEKDSAGNFRVYAIFYGATTKIDYSFNYAKFSIFEGGNTGTLTDISTEISVFGTDLKLTTATTADTNDKFIKANVGITYSASTKQNNGVSNYSSKIPVEIYLNPIDSTIVVNKNGNTVLIPETFALEIPGGTGIERIIVSNTVVGNLTISDLKEIPGIDLNDYPNILLAYLTAICDCITSNNKGISDFSLDIEILNRFGAIYSIEYNYPGEELKYIKDGYNITIPKDEDYRATKIIGLEIYRYQNGAFSKMQRDANNKDIKGSNGGASLGGANGVTYTLSNGTYKLVLTDNFGRVSTYYETYDANSVQHSITFAGQTKYIDTDQYTAKMVTITYDPSLYVPVFFITDDETHKTTFYRDVTTIQTSQTSIGKIMFNQDASHHTKFSVILLKLEHIGTDYDNALLERGEDLTYEAHKKILADYEIVHQEYKFILYTKLPTIQLKNLNGGIIANNNGQILIEDLIVLWNEKYNDGLTYDFNARLKLRRYYNGTNYNQIITTNNYKITLPGDYFLVLTNDLGYESTEINFTRAEGATILYSVYTKTYDGYSTQLFESSYTTTYNGKIVYHYYALDNFKNLDANDGSPNKSKDHIEIVTNTNNKISYSFVKEKSNINGTNLAQGEVNHAFYEIYSQGPDNKFTFRYIQINFIAKATDDFSKLNLLYQTTTEGVTTNNSINISSTNILKTTKDEIILFFATPGYNQVVGNSISLTHYFNGQFVESVKIEELEHIDALSIDGSQETVSGFKMSIKTGGLHRFEFRDLAGNVSRFAGYQYINICLVNSIVYNINEQEPVNGEIFNGDVILEVFTKLDNTTLYEDYTIEVFRNSLEHTYEVYNLNQYRFTQAGY